MKAPVGSDRDLFKEGWLAAEQGVGSTECPYYLRRYTKGVAAAKMLGSAWRKGWGAYHRGEPCDRVTS